MTANYLRGAIYKLSGTMFQRVSGYSDYGAFHVEIETTCMTIFAAKR
jgi:hypothetical protein